MFKIDKNLKGPQAEAFRTIRTNIKYSSVDKTKKTILVTSAEPSDGKSTTAMNLALTYAQEEGKKILLLDCDLRRPRVHKNFRLSNIKGLTDLLVEGGEVKEFVQRYTESLDILTTGKIAPNPAEMLASARMEEVLEKLKEQYDCIIIDSPPVMAVADSLILAPRVDGVLLVVRYEKTKGKLLLESKKKLDSVGANIIGATITGVKGKGEGYYYYYY